MRSVSFLFILLYFYGNSLHAKTISIPSDYNTIQQGINSSTNGDTVLVSPGTYFENINFNGKNIVLGSLFISTGDTSYISQTVIDGNEQGCVVVFENGEDSTTVLSGLTITHGKVENDSLRGSGITCINRSSPILNHLNVSENISDGNNADQNKYYGGAIFCSGYSCPMLENVIVTHNVAANYYHGGGLFCEDSSNVTIINSKVSLNKANYGGGMAFVNSRPVLHNVVLEGNRAYYGGGLFLKNSKAEITDILIMNNVARGFSGGAGGGIYCYNSSPSVINAEISCNITETAHHPGHGGGGIYLENGSDAFLKNILVYKNTTVANGGGIHTSRSSPRIFDVVIDGNSANNWGGGLYVVWSHKLLLNPYIERVRIKNNVSGDDGGGIFYHPSEAITILKDISICGNRSNGKGGGIATNKNLIFDAQSNCSIYLNKALDSGADVHLSMNKFDMQFGGNVDVVLDTTTLSSPSDYHIYPQNKINL